MTEQHRLDAALAALVAELERVTRDWERHVEAAEEADASRIRLRAAIVELERVRERASEEASDPRD